MTRQAQPLVRVGQWLRKLVGTPDPCDPADLAGSDLSGAHARAPDGSARSVVVGRHATDEAGSEPEQRR